MKEQNQTVQIIDLLTTLQFIFNVVGTGLITVKHFCNVDTAMFQRYSISHRWSLFRKEARNFDHPDWEEPQVWTTDFLTIFRRKGAKMNSSWNSADECTLNHMHHCRTSWTPHNSSVYSVMESNSSIVIHLSWGRSSFRFAPIDRQPAAACRFDCWLIDRFIFIHRIDG